MISFSVTILTGHKETSFKYKYVLPTVLGGVFHWYCGNIECMRPWVQSPAPKKKKKKKGKVLENEKLRMVIMPESHH
jgi:hypothetical protein